MHLGKFLAIITLSTDELAKHDEKEPFGPFLRLAANLMSFTLYI